MEQVFVLGFPALFTPHRVSRATVHLGLCCYE
ncbi:MAG: LPD28 domain-containing protein, partial [Faecousia sp.]